MKVVVWPFGEWLLGRLQSSGAGVVAVSAELVGGANPGEKEKLL